MYLFKFVCLCLAFVVASVCIASAQDISEFPQKDAQSPFVSALRIKRSPNSKYYKFKVPKNAVSLQPVYYPQPYLVGGGGGGGCGICGGGGQLGYHYPNTIGGGQSSSHSSSQSSSFGGFGGSSSSSQSSSFSRG